MRANFSRSRNVVLAALFAFALAGTARAQDDFFDSLGDKLKFSAFNGTVNTRVSGLLDMEGYYMQQPSPGLTNSTHPFLFDPRLTLFVDSQIGARFYFFAEVKADRGFDTADHSMRLRVDQYALRYSPWSDGRFNVQVGKFATVVGNYTNRYLSWDNPFITAPLPYENATSLWSGAAVNSYDTLLDWNNTPKNLRIPIIWGPSYALGAAVSGRVGKFDYAGEIKNTSLSAGPDDWNSTEGFSHPTFSGRIGYRPDEAWNIGVSASAGDYLSPVAQPTIPYGVHFGDYRSILMGQDASFAWHHWQLWAEMFETRFEIPEVGNADSVAYYLEAKYKFTPQLFGAVRWNQQVFNKVPDDEGQFYPWTDNEWRIDLALTYRFTANLQAKVQYSFMRMDGYYDPKYEHLVALQMTMRF